MTHVSGKDANDKDIIVLVDSSGRVISEGTLGGVTPKMDDTDKIGISLYGKASVAGDTAILAHATAGLRAGTYAQTGFYGDAAPTTALSFRAHDTLLAFMASIGWAYNGATFDRLRNNLGAQTALALEADTQATRNSADQVNFNHRTLRVTFVTGNLVGSTATYTLSLQHKYDGTNYATIWTAAAAVTVNATSVYDFGPGVNDVHVIEAAEMSIPRDFRLVVTVGGTADGSNNMDTSVFYDLGV